jgi:hypothetical protein
MKLARQLRTAKVDQMLNLKACEDAGGVWLTRTYSKLPAEYENFYKGVQQPIRYDRPRPRRIFASRLSSIKPSWEATVEMGSHKYLPNRQTSAQQSHRSVYFL